ncbi:MAG: ATP-binding protein [archaeon]
MTYKLTGIQTDYDSFAQVIDLYHNYQKDMFGIIGLSFQNWFGANMSSPLGAVLDLLEANLNTIKIEDFSVSSILKILKKNDFLSHYGYNRLPDTNNTTIKYLKLKPSDGRYFHMYIVNELLTRSELPAMSLGLKKKITEAIYEIFINAKYHSGTKYIYTCGQFFPKKNEIEFTLTDTGDGFKKVINRRFNKNLSAIQAIKWATQDEHSTKIGVPGGIGLSILKEFIVKNQGKIQIISDDGYYEYSRKGEEMRSFQKPFPGSALNVQLRTDDTHSYKLSDEKNGDIF